MDVPKPPEDLELRNIIDKLAQFVARNGPEFEQMTKNKQSSNPKFLFLFGGEFNEYYRFRVSSEQAMLKNTNEIIPKGAPMPQLVNTYYPLPSLPPQPFPQTSQAQTQFLPPPPHHPLPPPPPPFREESFLTNNSQFHQIPSAPNFNNWQPSNHPQLSISQPMNNIESQNNIDPQITQFQEHIKESEKNLNAQHEMIMGQEKEKRIDELITKLLDDELKRMCEDYNINLNEFDKILQPIIESCRKESIANGKIWIFNNCNIPEHYDAVAKHLLKRVTRVDSKFEAKLHIMYLINDIFNHCMRKNDEKLKTSIVKIIVPAFSSVLVESNDERKQKMNKLLKLWEMNQYLDHSLLDQLKSPEESLDAYKTSLRNKYLEQIKSIENEQTNKNNQIQKQHNDFVAHCNLKIQQLQHQKTMQANITPIRPAFPNVPNANTSNMFAPITSGQVSGTLLHHAPPPRIPNPPPTSLPYPTQPANFVTNHQMTPNVINPAASQQPPLHLSLQRAPFQTSFSNPQGQHPPTNFFPNNSGPPVFPPNSLPPASMLTIPSPAANIHTSTTTIPPPPQILPMIPKPEEIQSPYFERPAGIMTTLIKLEDFDYNPIDPKDIKMPPLLPPSERLLQALEAFYAPPTHEHPRNGEGWEKLGLYEFFKAKSQARKEYETNVFGHEQQKDCDQFDDSDSSSLQTFSDKQSDNNRKTFSETSNQSSPPKRCYKEFKEEKSPIRSSRSPEKRHLKPSRSQSPSRSVSKSPKSRRKESSPKYSRRKSRSKSPEFTKFNSVYDKRDTNNRQSDSKKGHHQLSKKITSSSNAGFTIKQNYRELPISAGPTRTTSSDQYRGFGTSSIVSNASDPFESFRRNKGQAYIQRIREGRRD